MNSIVLALTQVKTNGRIAREELRQFAESGIPIYTIMREELGLTREELANIGDMQIDGDIGVAAILRGLEKRYKGAAERIANTLPGMMETIRDDVLIIGNEMFKAPYMAFKGFIKNIRDGLEEARNILGESGLGGVFENFVPDRLEDPIRRIVGALTSLAASIKTVVGAFGPSIQIFGTVSTILLSYFLPAIAYAANSLANFINAAMIAVPGLKYFAAALIGLLVANSVGRSLAFLWRIMRFGMIAAVVARAVMTLAGAIKYLSLMLMKGPTKIIGVIMLVAGALVALALSSELAQKWLAKISGTLGGLMDIDVGGILQPENSDVNKWAEKYNQDLEDMYGNLDKAKGGVGGVGDAAKDAADKAKEAGKKVEDTFVASFDELFQVPEKLDEVGKGMEDIGGMGPLDPGGNFDDLKIPEINVPDIKMPGVPELPSLPEPDGGFPDMLPPGKFNPGNWRIKFPPVNGTAFLESIDALLASLGAALDAAGAWAGSWVTETVGAINGWVAETGNAFRGWAVDTGMTIITWTATTGIALATWAVTNYNRFRTWATNTGVAIGNWTINTLADFQTWATGVGVTVATWAVNTYNDVRKWGTDTGRTISSWATRTWNNFRSWTTDTASDIGGWVSDTASDIRVWSTGTIATIGTWAARNAGRIGSWVSSTASNVSSWASNTARSFGSWAGNTYSTVRNWASQSGNRIGSFFSNMLNETFGAHTEAGRLWREHKDDIGNTVDYLVRGAVLVFGGLPGKLAKALGSLGSKILPKFDDLLPGIRGIIDDIVSAFRGLGDKIGRAIKKIPKIDFGSPSMNFGIMGGIRGYATGGLIDKDSIIRAGEGGKREAIVPLENPTYMAPFSKAVARDLAAMTGNSGGNTGTAPVDNRPILYVANLIADDKGLKALERKLNVIRINEDLRGAQ